MPLIEQAILIGTEAPKRGLEREPKDGDDRPDRADAHHTRPPRFEIRHGPGSDPGPLRQIDLPQSAPMAYHPHESSQSSVVHVGRISERSHRAVTAA